MTAPLTGANLPTQELCAAAHPGFSCDEYCRFVFHRNAKDVPEDKLRESHVIAIRAGPRPARSSP